MALTPTPRAGLITYTAGTDPHPGRVKFNEERALFDAIMALAFQGATGERPAAGKFGRFYWDTTVFRLFWDDGVAWQDVNTNGGGGAGGAIAPGAAAIEGVSARGARADHTHTLALATAAVHGAMSAADKEKLDGATAAATANTLASRDASGRVQVAAPTTASEATNKSYVDTAVATRAASVHTHDAADTTSGIFAPARLPAATTAAAGSMSAADKAKLDAAASANTVSTIAMRDSSGDVFFRRVNAVDQPTTNNALTRKDYVDTADALKAPLASPAFTGTPTGITKTHVGLGSVDNTSDTAKPVSTAQQTALDLKAPLASPAFTGTPTGITKTHVGLSNVDNTADAAKPVSTAAQTALNLKFDTANNRAQQTAVKPETDAPSTFPLGLSYFGAGTADGYPNGLGTVTTLRNAASRAWQTMTGKIASDVWVRTETDGDVWTAWKKQATDAVATGAVNGLMSAADKAKLDASTSAATASTLVLRNSNGAITGNVFYSDVAQDASTNSLTRKDYVDGKVWDGADITTGLVAAARLPVSTGSVPGTMSAADKAKLDAATALGTASTLVVRDAGGLFAINAPTAGGHPASKQYVDGMVWDGSDITTGTVAAARLPVSTGSVPGTMSAADKAKLDAATNGAGLADTLVKRSGVYIDVAAPVNGPHPTTKTYVDAKTWDGADIATGTVAAARLPVATGSVPGTMSAADKAKLDAATSAPTASTLAQRNSAGRIQVEMPGTDTTAATPKAYVDAEVGTDTGWLATGVTLTLGADFTLTTYRIRKVKNELWAYIQLTYTGADFTTDADGNISNKTMVTMPTGYRPIHSWAVPVTEWSVRSWCGQFGVDGAIQLSHGPVSKTITSGAQFWITANVMAD